MSKNVNEVYDATLDAVNYVLLLFKRFYDTHPVEDNPNDSVAFNFKLFVKLLIKGWLEIEKSRHPYDYNSHMAGHTDVSDRTLRKYYKK